MTRLVAILLSSLAILLGGCGDRATSHALGASSQPQPEASTRLGDTVVRANAIPTTTLGEAVAAQYGITRNAKTVMLLIGVRRGAESVETAVAARVTASATDLLGKRQTIAMREVRSGAFVDYVGVANVIAPDTLHFDIEILDDHGQRMALQFNRDFFPQP